MKKSYKYILYIFGFLILISLFSGGSEKTEDKLAVSRTSNDTQEEAQAISINETINTPVNSIKSSELYKVTRVVDGDTIDVSVSGQIERIRIIGINTPETVDPRKPVECYGTEASNQAKALLSNKSVRLEIDPSQGERDKYDRLLRYVFLEDGTDFGLKMIQEGYAYEYTYDTSYRYQSSYKNAQQSAEKNKAGLWGDKCNGITETKVITPVTPITSQTETSTTNSCVIKGNINSKKEKIYHTPGCGSYNQTVIDESKGEKWFCSEQDALDAGWRKALNCS